MPRTFTVAQLITRARQRAEMESDTFLSDAELKGILSTGYGELYSTLVESGMRYFESAQSIVTDGGATYALPSDHLSTIGVDYMPNGTSGDNPLRIPLGELMAQERHAFSGSGRSQAVGYALTGSELTLYPAPKSGQEYEHVYVPQPDDLTSAADTDTVDVVTPDGEAFLDAYLLVEMLDKEGDMERLPGALAKRERAKERIEKWALLRSLNEMRRPVVNDFDPMDGYGRPLSRWWDR